MQAGWLSARPLHPLRIANRSNRAPRRAASSVLAPQSARQTPSKGNFLRQSCCLMLLAGGFPLAPCTPSGNRRANGAGICAYGRVKGLSSGQTIGAARTAVRFACCLPERPVANRLRRLYPLDARFPSFPFGNLRATKVSEISPLGGSKPRRAACPREETPNSVCGR